MKKANILLIDLPNLTLNNTDINIFVCVYYKFSYMEKHEPCLIYINYLY